MRRLIILLAVLLPIQLMAQTMTVKGVVKDAVTGETLPGVNILVKGTSRGDTTDFDGNFSLSNLNKGDVLVFSYLGFETKEVIVDKSQIEVLLSESSESLDEIVVVGYGTQRKKEVTGAVSVLGKKTIEKLNPARVEEALQGQVAGVNITSSSGAPGAGLNIRIRGVSTNGDSRPLILLDGAVIEDLSVVNPNDIESINVLKDATAGIYGVRAANGVILITTKTGRTETDFKFNLSTYAGIQTTTRKIPVLNGTEYAMLANEAYAANGEALPFPNVSGIGQGTNWQDEVFSTAPVNELNFSMQKGYKKSYLGLSIAGFDQQGIVGLRKSDFNRVTVKLDYNVDLAKNLKLNTTTFFFNTNRSFLNEGGLGSVLFNALNMPSNLDVTDDAPTNGVGIEVINPIDQMAATFNNVATRKITANWGLNYKFLEHFTADVRMQLNHSTTNFKAFLPAVNFGGSKVFNNPVTQYDRGQGSATDYTFDAFVKYERSFDEAHNLKVLLATSVFQTSGINSISARFNAEGTDLSNFYPTTLVRNNLIADNVPRLGYDVRLLSYFTRVQYDYKGKYLFSGTLRRDGSSIFGPENRFGYFPTASVGWAISEEDFLKDSKTIDILKLRASYGIIGNDRIAENRFLSLLDGQGQYVFNDQVVNGLATGPVANPLIKWEKQIPFNVGLDIGLFNKVDITADYFIKRTEDLLVNPETSQLLGVTAPGSTLPLINAGDIENRGYEFSINYRDNITKDLSFTLNYNFATVENEVLFVGSDTGILFGGAFGVGQEIDISRMEAGFPIGYFYGLRTDGIFQNNAEVAAGSQPDAVPGDIRFVDLNEDGIIDDNDRTYLGDPIPDLTMGLNLTVNYKNFDLTTSLFGSFGNQIVRNYERTTPLTNRTIYDLDRWTGPGTSTTVPRVTTGATRNTLFSDFYVEDGDFIRIQNVQLGYTFDANQLESMGLSRLRIYAQALNLFTFTKYRGFDPSFNNGASIGGGIDNGAYPVPRRFALGLNVSF